MRVTNQPYPAVDPSRPGNKLNLAWVDTHLGKISLAASGQAFVSGDSGCGIALACPYQIYDPTISTTVPF